MVNETIGVYAVMHIEQRGLQRVINAVKAKASAGILLPRRVVGRGVESVRPGHQRADPTFSAMRVSVGFETNVGDSGHEALSGSVAGGTKNGEKHGAARDGAAKKCHDRYQVLLC